MKLSDILVCNRHGPDVEVKALLCGPGGRPFEGAEAFDVVGVAQTLHCGLDPATWNNLVIKVCKPLTAEERAAWEAEQKEFYRTRKDRSDSINLKREDFASAKEFALAYIRAAQEKGYMVIPCSSEKQTLSGTKQMVGAIIQKWMAPIGSTARGEHSYGCSAEWELGPDETLDTATREVWAATQP